MTEAMIGFRLHLFAVTAGLLLDMLLGDPKFLPHPVRAIGLLIKKLEKRIRGLCAQDERGELAGGRALVLTVLLATGGTVGLLCFLAASAGWAWLFATEAILCYYALAARSLSGESMKVYSALKKGDKDEARAYVAMIVGRDTDNLTEEGIAKAAVETVAENTSDGVIAPLFYLLLGGPFLGWIYKAVNTMDSMVGYQNSTYLYFGRAAAKLDDWFNIIPSRLSALFMTGAAALLGFDARNAARIFKRDRYNHKSPNSAQTESVCAGALQIQLGGNAWYFGKLCEKPVIGDASRAVEYQDIKRANKLMYMTTVLCLAAAAVLIGLLT